MRKRENPEYLRIEREKDSWVPEGYKEPVKVRRLQGDERRPKIHEVIFKGGVHIILWALERPGTADQVQTKKEKLE